MVNQTANAHSGAAAQINFNTTRTEYNFYKQLNLSAYSSTALSFWYQINVSSTTDYLIVDYSTAGATGPWTQLFRRDTDQLTWTQAPTITSIPAGGNVWLRFRGTLNRNGEYARVDDIVVTGNQGGFVALPLGSNAAVSCQNNPNGAECHSVADVASLHSGTAAACGACHGATLAKNCQTAGCHPGVNLDEHVNTGLGTPAHHENGGNFATFATVGECAGCHDNSVANEHFVLTANTGKPCSVCHATNYTVGTYSPAKATVSAQVASRTITCNGCHTTSTQTAPHVQRMGTTTTLGSTQFSNSWSGHRSFTSMPGQKTSFTAAVDGVSANRTWTLPTLSDYVTNWDPVRVESSTMTVLCTDCHGSITGATGPHGASMTVNIAAGYDNSYSTGAAYLNSAAPFIRSTSGGTPLCAKCHQTANFRSANNTHSRNNHNGTTGGRCINCHSKTPHAWKRPRLIGYRSDPAPYQSMIVNGITDRSYAPRDWQESDCGVTGCGSHGTNPTAPTWP